jgi:hypothetical protein
LTKTVLKSIASLVARKMQKYELDLETLLSLLEEMNQNSILFTNMPSGFLGQRTGCQVRIDLVAGKVAYCHIEDSEGRVHVLGNQKAFSLLYGMGPLEWFVETRLPEIPSLADSNAPPPGTRFPTITRSLPPVSSKHTIPLWRMSSVVPRQVVNIEPRVLQTLSRNQRRVLVLVDGTRNIEKIASILYSSSRDSIQAVLKTLRELESLRLIAMEI